MAPPEVTVHDLVCQIKSTLGGVKVFFSWQVQNPSEALYDVMEEIYGGTKSIHIGWVAEAADSALPVTYRFAISDNTTIATAPLYGSIVGAQAGQNDFTMSYKDSGFHQTAGLLTLIAAFLAFVNNLL